MSASHRGLPTATRLTLCAILTAGLCPSDVHAGCKLFDDMIEARKQWEIAFKEFHDVKTDAALERILSTAEGILLIDLDEITDFASGHFEVSDAEQDAFNKWIARRNQARAKLDAATAAMKSAAQAWRDAFNKKEDALTKADAIFRKDRLWLRAEQDALAKMTVNSPEYLDQAAKITSHLKANYAQMIAELGPNRDCFPDVQIFLTDIEQRVTRIAEVEAEIARRRGLVAGAPPPPSTPADPADATLGPTWVCSGPTVTVVRDSQNLVTSATASKVSWRVVAPDGTTGDAVMTLTNVPKLRLRVGEYSEMTINAAAQKPAYASGGWYPLNFGGPVTKTEDDGGFETSAGNMVAVWHRNFIGTDTTVTDPPRVEARIGRNIGNATFDPYVTITWVYRLEGAATK